MKIKKPTYWTDAVKHLSDQSPVLADIIAGYPGETLTGKKDAFFTLTRAIIGQQISVKAADSIWGRLEEKLNIVIPENVLRQQDDDLRNLGLSRQKVAYMQNIAQHFVTHNIDENHWENRDPDHIVTELCSIKGVGPWTAEMFLIFYVMHPDIFPIKDLGLINAIKRNFGEMEIDQIKDLADNWKPYRTVATWYLWRSIDPVPVEY